MYCNPNATAQMVMTGPTTRPSTQQGVKHRSKARNDGVTTSKFVGVSRMINGEWQACIWKGSKCVHTKACLSETGAARQYDAWAREIFGKDAKLNVTKFPYIGVLQ